jgi:E3 ubiquitin-protein ligase NEDD4
MSKIDLFFSENDIEGVIDETFTTVEDRFGELVTIELKPGGASIPVTEENKKDYVEYVALFVVRACF